jgi:hypothetical protein
MGRLFYNDLTRVLSVIGYIGYRGVDSVQEEATTFHGVWILEAQETDL